MQFNAIILVFATFTLVHSQKQCCNNICMCDHNIINCNDKNITLGHFPCSKGEAAANGIRNGTIQLSGNILTVLDLDLVPDGIVNVEARDSHILQLMVGTKTDLQRLDVKNNRIVSLVPLKALTHLTELDISLNPVPEDEFSNDLLRILGRTLRSLHLGNHNLRHFPQGITHHLPMLDTLEITNVPFPYLSPTAFSSFRYRIANLTIRNTDMQSIPYTLQQLPNLKELHFDGNPVTDYGINPTVFDGLQGLEILSLRNNLLTTFPSIVEKLPKIKSLSLDDNQLVIIRDEAINMINKSNIEHLSLANCSLDRIPGALGIIRGNYLSKLKSLNLDRNFIQSIDRDDVHDLASLETLTLEQNPLQYISKCAFHGLGNLRYVNLARTQLAEIPLALANLNTGNHELNVNLFHTEVECTCDMVSFQKTLGIQNGFTIDGNCNTISTRIEEYLRIRIPHCPNYQHDPVINNNCSS